MKCPACSNNLSEIDIDDIKVDVCKSGCGGIWFDWHELKKFDEKHEACGEFLLDIVEGNNVKIDLSKRRVCPRCEDEIIMLRHFSSVKKEIEVDECGNCGGFWLDYGELNRLREQFDTQQEREMHAKKYISKVCDPVLELEHQKTKDKTAKTKEMVKIFRFICPTNYIPGEQEYGAF